MNIGDIKRAYFIGIGGIGMSALARYLKSRGIKVSGYDRTPTPLTEALNKEGIAVHFEDNPAGLPRAVDLVVYTPAVPESNKEFQYFKEHNYEILKRSQVLGMITRDCPTIAVAGTHGKTTVSSITAQLFRGSGRDISAFLGGIAVNFNTNFLSGEDDLVVVEADEYDRSFLQLNPKMALVTSMDPDHMDIYGTEENMRDSFFQFAGQVQEEGVLILKSSLPFLDDFQQIPGRPKKLFTYNLEQAADFEGQNLRIDNESYLFDLKTPEGIISDLRLNVGGRQNVENAVAALSLALCEGLEPEALREALAQYKGVRRRFEYKIRQKDRIMIDDYAHHPEELRVVISSARQLYPEKKITVIFQPHLYTRTRDLADGFAESLSLADCVYLLPIFPAREEPIPGVTSEMIFEKITITDKNLCTSEILVDEIATQDPEVLIVTGAGDISKMVRPLKVALLRNISRVV